MHKNTLIWDESYEFIDILKKLDENGNGFLMIIDDNNQLLGMVTDGDIRRSILNKKTDIWEVINTKPITANYTMERSVVENILKSNRRRQIPIVNDKGQLVDIFFLNDNAHYYEPNYVVIMAGGLGSRLGELTKDLPKPMLSVGGKPIIENILISFREAGFNNFILCVNYKADLIIDYLGNGSNLNINITYVKEDFKMGTAGALSLIDKKLINDPFFVVNGDILATIDYNRFLTFHKSSNSKATMCTKKIEYQIPYACVTVNSDLDLVEFQEKPLLNYNVNAGVYLLNPEILDLIPKETYYDMTTLFSQLLERKLITKCYELNDYWLDIGQKKDYTKANEDLNYK